MNYGTGCKKNDFKIGDMILYPYVEGEVLRGRVLKLMEDKIEIEVSFPGKKSEDLNTEILTVDYNEILPMSKGIKSYQTKLQKKSEKEKKNNK